MKVRLTTLLLVGLFPVLAQAQEHRQHHPEPQAGQQGMMQMEQEHQMQGMGMMGMMATPSPDAILQQKDALQLNDAQVQSLEALKKELAEVHKAHMTEAMPLHAEATQALKGDKPDLARYEAVLKKLAGPHVKMQVEMARFGQRAMEVLTAEQRANVRYGMRLMRDAMGGTGMMESHGCAMMGGQRMHSN